MSDSCALYPLPGLVPTARQLVVPVVEQVQLARDTYRLRLAAPELARDVVPGQFFMIRQPGVTNPLMGRPFALYDTVLDGAGRPAGIDVVYLVVGKMTGLMSRWKAGDPVELWGPLGNGFPAPQTDRLLVVGGGIGVTPFLAVAREALGLRQYGARAGGKRCNSVTLCYGVRSAEYFAGLDDFRALGIDIQLATDDGTRGHRGFVTELVAAWLRKSGVEDAPQGGGEPERRGDLAGHLSVSPSPPLSVSAPVPSLAAIYCCGPEPMMHAVAELAAGYKVPCWLSLETPMACGFGACFSCVTKVKLPDGNWDYRRVCVEGPIFPADQLAT